MSKQVLLPISNEGLDPVRAALQCAQGEPLVVFQLLWSPQHLGERHPDSPPRYECQVLLGEAVAPPLSSLSSKMVPHRLPLYQIGRRAPAGCCSFETWRNGGMLDELLQRAKEDDDAQAQLAEIQHSAATSVKASSRDRQLSKLFKDMQHRGLMQPSSDPPLSPTKALQSPSIASTTMGSPSVDATSPPFSSLMASPAVSALTPYPASVSQPSPRSRMVNATIRSPRRPLACQVALKRCVLDVDIAWHPESGRYGPGVVQVVLRSTLVPPCCEGRLRVRICELEASAVSHGGAAVDHILSLQSPSVATEVATEGFRALAHRLDAMQSRIEPPPFPEMRPLWTSSFRCLGFDPPTTRCFVEWNEGFDIRLNTAEKLREARRYGSMRDHLPPLEPFAPMPPETVRTNFVLAPEVRVAVGLF